jgi:glycosyltransferase involved in cell wall biosynthesis
MKKVLLISYYFPPSGGPGVQRVLKFVKYLPQFGWEPVVLTVEDGDFPARDESLLKEIPKTAKVYRTKIFEPYRLYRKFTGKPANAPVDVENIPHGVKKRPPAQYLADVIRSTFFIPDARIGWMPYALPGAIRITREENIDAIYSSSPPYTAALIARAVHRRTGLPWIAGFRDPWVGFISSPERWILPRRIDSALEHSVYRDATIVEAAWKGILLDFNRKYPGVDVAKCLHLPNGYDPEDYPILERETHDRFTIVYTGSMYGRRNPKTFLQAVEELVAEGAVATENILLRFIGRFGSEVQEMIRTSRVSNCAEIISYLPHGESIQHLLRADALLLVVDESKESAEIVPGKVFEYIGARRPILALAQEGAVSEIMRETGAGFVAGNHDIPAIKNAFIECYRNFLYHTKQFEPNERALMKYNRKEITRQLAEALDSLFRQR